MIFQQIRRKISFDIEDQPEKRCFLDWRVSPLSKKTPLFRECSHAHGVISVFYENIVLFWSFWAGLGVFGHFRANPLKYHGPLEDTFGVQA